MQVCKLRTKDVLLGRITGWEKVLAVCTLLRLLAVTFMVPIVMSFEKAYQGNIAWNIAWASPLFATAVSMLVLIRRAASGKDEAIRRRVIIRHVHK